MLTCHKKGKCLWHDEFADKPKEPETVHGNEVEKEVCDMCGKECELRSEHLCEDCFNSLP